MDGQPGRVTRPSRHETGTPTKIAHLVILCLNIQFRACKTDLADLERRHECSLAAEAAPSAEGIMRRRDLFKLAGATVLPARFAIAQPAGAHTLRFVPQNNLSVLDPIFTTASGTTNHGWAIYDTLFGVNSRQEVKPQMADGFTLSDDGRTYLIRLRDGLNFHNGEPVRAQDCAPSLARWAARTSLGQEIAKFVDAWGVQDDRTVKITLKQPLPIFIWALAKDSGIIPFMMPEHMARTDPFKQITETIGSGPYLFAKDEFVSGSSATYRAKHGVCSAPGTGRLDLGREGGAFRPDRVEGHPGFRHGSGGFADRGGGLV